MEKVRKKKVKAIVMVLYSNGLSFRQVAEVLKLTASEKASSNISLEECLVYLRELLYF